MLGGWTYWLKCYGINYTGGDSDMITYEDKTPSVGIWQTALNVAGFSVGSSGVDGSFGPDTRDATNAFKDAVGISQNNPCTVGFSEWLAMADYRAAQNTGVPQDQYDKAVKEAEDAKIDLVGAQLVSGTQKAELEATALAWKAFSKIADKYGGTLV